MRDAGGVEGSFSYSPKTLSSLRDPESFSLQSSGRRTPPLSSRVPSLTDSGASGHAPSLPLPAFLQSFSRHPAPAPRGLGSGLVVPVPGPGGSLGRRVPGLPAGRAALAPMESQCDYSMYFPAVPLPPRAELAGDPGRYRALPRRNHLYLGETVRFLLVLRCRGAAGSGAGGGPGLGSRGAWAELATALAALASVSAGGGPGDPDPEPPGGGDPGGGGLFRGCSPLLTHGPGPATSGGVTTVRTRGDLLGSKDRRGGGHRGEAGGR